MLAPAQITGAFGRMSEAGLGFTATVSLLEAVHPIASVAVTSYVVVTAGLTLIVCDVAPVLHRYVYGGTPPDGFASSVTLPPSQVAGAFGRMSDIGSLTVTVSLLEAVHPVASVTVAE
jgi:hypothetical protein